jgi:ureidoacrylate peracid hydrolase
MLRNLGIDTLLITGVATSTCCESTARDAAMWGYRTI